jgi:hypothetical protein
MAMAVFRKGATGNFLYQTVNFRQARTPCLCPDFGHCPPSNALQLALFTQGAVAYKQASDGFALPAESVQKQTTKASTRTPQRTA